jgi:hypothetical protein
LDQLEKWRLWTAEYELANFEKRWGELELQESCRASALERLKRAEKPAYIAELFSLQQVSF